MRIGIRRITQHYVTKFLFRSGVIAALACVSTFIPSVEIGDRLALMSTILLTLTGINYTSSDSLPALPYSTALDEYHEACHYLVYGVIAHNISFFLYASRCSTLCVAEPTTNTAASTVDPTMACVASADAPCAAASEAADIAATVASRWCRMCGYNIFVDFWILLDLDDFVMSFIFAYWIYWNFKWFAIHNGLHQNVPRTSARAATHGLHQNVPGTSAVPGTNPARAAFSTSSDMGSSVAQTQRSAHADYSHYFAKSDGRDAQGLEGDASASVLQLPHGVELRSSSRSRGGPLRADMFSVELIPSDHPLAAGALSETLHIKVVHTATAAAGTAADDDDVPSPLLLRMPHRASAEQLEHLAFYRAETLDSEMELVEGGCFWSDGYAEVEVTSFSVWWIAPLLLVATVSYTAAALAAAQQQLAAAVQAAQQQVAAAAVAQAQAAQQQLAAAAAAQAQAAQQHAEANEKLKQAVSTRTYIDRPVGVAAFAPNDPEAPRILRFVLHPVHEDPPPDNYYTGFCKVGDDKEVAVRRGKTVTITLRDLPELGVTFASWRNTRQSEIIPRVLELGPSSSHSSLLMAVISQPGVVPHHREFPLMLPTAAAAVPEASRASSAQLSFSPSRSASAHHAQLLMSLPEAWE
jgi:hypothetical protein